VLRKLKRPHHDEPWGTKTGAQAFVDYGVAVGAGIAAGSVIGYVAGAFYGLVWRRDVDQLSISGHTGLLGGWAVLVFLFFRITGLVG
jgi:hypothetical protein